MPTMQDEPDVSGPFPPGMVPGPRGIKMTADDMWSPAAQPQAPSQRPDSDPQPRRKHWAARHKVWTALLAGWR